MRRRRFFALDFVAPRSAGARQSRPAHIITGLVEFKATSRVTSRVKSGSALISNEKGKAALLDLGPIAYTIATQSRQDPFV
jgi:hypothetical protein